jgi:2-oxoisovalerate dehydrogenase E1 component beta subunit
VRTAFASALDELGVALAEDPSESGGLEPKPHSSGGILRTGSDLSVIAVNGIGPAVEWAALQLGSEGVSVEVVELNGNREWSEQAVLESVRKTSKVVLVHEAEDGAEAAELAALIAERAFENLDGPVRRVRVDTDLAETLRDLAGF